MMSTLNKTLLIVPDVVNANIFVKYHKGTCDVLAITPGAMLSLDVLNVPYKTFEDIYDTEAFRDDLIDLQEKTENILSELDMMSEEYSPFPYAYSGNINYILSMFANILYLHKISVEIEKYYSSIYLFSNTEPRELSWGRLSYSDLKTFPQSRGLDNKIQILRNLLNVKEVINGLQDLPAVPSTVKVKAFLKEFPIRLKNGMKKKRIPIVEKWDLFDIGVRKDANLGVVQDGHEVGYLRKYMPEYKFINIAKMLENKAPYLIPANYDYEHIRAKLHTFLEGCFPRLKLAIESLFMSYHREVVGRLPKIMQEFEKLLYRYNPQMLLYSVGRANVVDGIIAYMANERNIPITSFQHGGSAIVIKDYFHKYLERDEKTRKTLILSSKAEKEHANHRGSKCLVHGSMQQFQFVNDYSQNHNDKVLYCCSPFIFYNYINVLYNVSDKHLYQVNRDILEACKEEHLGLDVKLHPVQEDYNFHYFRQLISTVGCSKAQIIYGQLAQSIMKGYGLIIFDFLGTAALLPALSLKVPVILYLRDLSIVNDCVLKDIKERCYIVHNKDMLAEVLNKYAAGNLPSKWSMKIVDRYVYPVDKGHPGPNIANYIRSVCSSV